MRFVVIVILGLLLALPAMAQSKSSNGGGGRVFASATCPQHVACPDGESTEPPDQLAAQGTYCISEYLGYHNSSGFFDTSAGLDSSNCLTPLPNSISKGIGAQLYPKCCLIKQPDNSCVFHCDLISTQ